MPQMRSIGPALPPRPRPFQQMSSIGPQIPGGMSAAYPSPADLANPSPDYLAMHTQGPLGQANQVTPELQRLIAQRQAAIRAMQANPAANSQGGNFKYGAGLEQGVNNLMTAPIQFRRR